MKLHLLSLAWGYLACFAARDGWVDRTFPFLQSAVVAQAVECVLAVAFRKIYVGSSPTIGIFLYVAQAVEHVLAAAFGNKLCSSPTVGIFLYVAQAVECVLAVGFRKIYVGSSPTIGIFLYVAQAVERVLAAAFRNKVC